MGLFEIFSSALTGFYALVPSLGLAIMLLTVAVRLILLPLSIKQTRSMREMQRIQPEVKKLQQKHKGDRQKMNEELMALYKEHGVNPFGGCAPLLLQFPVLIGLFYVIRAPLAYMGFQSPQVPSGVTPAPADFQPRDVGGFLDTLQSSALARDLMDHAVRTFDFLGLNLSCSANGILRPPSESTLQQASSASRELMESCGSGLVPALPYLLLVLLMGFTTWYQQKQMQATQDPKNPQAAQMQMLARIMPIMLMVFAFTFPTGVVLYWLVTNLWTIGQQRLMLHAAPPLPAAGVNSARASTSATKPETGKPPKGAPSKPSGEGAESGAKSKPHPSSKKKRKRR